MDSSLAVNYLLDSAVLTRGWQECVGTIVVGVLEVAFVQTQISFVAERMTKASSSAGEELYQGWDVNYLPVGLV